MYKLLGYLSIAALLLAQLMVSATAQEEEQTVDDLTRDCISVRMIRTTDIIDDRNMLFYMRGGDVYHNILPRRCNGLAREDRFSYRPTASQLCRQDTIRVLEDSGFGMREGIACGLGPFHEITEEDAEALKTDPGEVPEARPLPMPEPDEVGAEEEETQEPETG